MFLDIHKEQGRSSSNSGYKIQTTKAVNILAQAHFWHNKYENSELD